MNTHFIKLFSALLLGAAVMTSCLKDNDDLNNLDIPQAGFTMINAFSPSDYVIHKADNNFIQSMNNPLQFKGINFAYLYPGNRKILTVDADNKVLIDSTYTIKDNVLYTSIIYTKPNAKAGQALTEDKLINNLGINSAYRFLNLAHNEPEIDFYIGEVKVVDNRSYDGNTIVINNFNFESITSGAKKLVAKNQDEQVVAEKDFDFNPKMYYSLILIRNTKNNNNYELLVYEQYRN